MPEATSITLYQKKSSAILLLLGCVAFVACGIWMIPQKPFVAVLGIAFFGFGILVAIAQMLPGSTYLRISETEIAFANLYRVTTIPWEAIDCFFVVPIKHNGMTVRTMVAYNFVPNYKAGRIGRRVNSLVAGCEGALPDTYGKKPAELAELLNRCLAQFKDNEEQATCVE